mgnify:CR=1 FL=1
MADSQTISEAGLERRTVGDTTRIAAHGAWTIDTVAALEREVPEAVRGAAGRVTVDLSGITFIDTAGAWLISRIEAGLRAGPFLFASPCGHCGSSRVHQRKPRKPLMFRNNTPLVSLSARAMRTL